MRRLFYVLGLPVCLFAILSFASCSIFEDNSFKVGLYESGNPLVFMEDKKAYAGFEVDVAQEISDRLDKKLRIVPLAPGEAADALENGSVDCVVSSLATVHKSIENFSATTPFISYGIAIVKHTDDMSITDLQSLVGKEVAVMANTEADALCEEMLKRIHFNLRRYDLPYQPFHEVLLKNKDAILADEYLARHYEKSDPQIYKTLDIIVDKKGYGVRLSDKLSEEDANAIDGTVLEMKSDGTLSDLYLKWFDYSFPA